MESKTSTMCNIEKDIHNFYKKQTKCKYCNRERGLKRYFKSKDKISFQQKIYYEKNRDKNLIQKQNINLQIVYKLKT